MQIGFLLLYYLASKTYREHMKTDGNDHRVAVLNLETSEQNLQNIAKIFERRRQLDYLRNTSVPIHMKMRLLDNRAIGTSNMFAGGLMTAFDFPPPDAPEN